MHYFLIAGEASGDLHGAGLIRALRREDPAARFSFIGGDAMAAAAGTAPIIHLSRMAYMGFSQVLAHLPQLYSNLRQARTAVTAARPDALILIDYPSFNLKVAEHAFKARIPIYYYISPKIWAWKKWRIRTIRRLVRRVFSILPFEPEYYISKGFEATYVGNPSVGEIEADLARALPRAEFLASAGLPDKPLLALMPGSRKGEIRANLPVMLQAAAATPHYRPVIVAAPGISAGYYAHCGAGDAHLVRTEASQVLVHARAALVTSGTATLEAALAGVPQVALYRSNGSRIAYEVMKRILDVKYVTLPNLIAGREVIPELLLHRCTPEAVARALSPLLADSPQRQAQTEGYAAVRRALGNGDAPATTAELIVADLTVGKSLDGWLF